MPKYTTKKAKLADMVSEAFGEITALGEEMREAFDNTPESLQQSGVGERRGEAADNLENISEVDVPESLGSEEIEYSVPDRTPAQLRKLSRTNRRDDAEALLSYVIGHLQEKVVDDDKRTQDLRDEASSLIDDLENAKGELEAVEFPGMFG